MEAMITIRNICKTYRSGKESFNALSSIHLQVLEGEFIAIMGRSGSGKSTLLNIIAGIDQADQGEYNYCTENIHAFTSSKLTKFRRQLGFVFQSFHLIPHLTVKQNVELPLGYAGVASKLRKEISTTMLERVGLADKSHAFPKELSGGQMQRVAIARALAPSPKLLLADEPTGNLDNDNGMMIMNLLVDINKVGTTIILVTHDEKIADFASRRIIMSDGAIIAE